MKTVFLVPDGMGGWPLEELGGKTTLEAANTPHMDEMAKNGIVGRCQTVPHGMPPGSDVANMALLGFAPGKYHTGRGPIEAAAQGLEPGPDDLVWRLNTVSVTGLGEGDNMLDYSAGHISTEESTKLVERLQEELGDDIFTFIPGVQYRHLLVQKNGALTEDAKLVPSPPHDITDKPIAKDLETYASSPKLNELLFKAQEILAKDNPTKANSIWPWGQGRPLILPSFRDKYGIGGAVISAVDLIKGLGFASGLEAPEVPDVTGLVDTNYEGKVAEALKTLETEDFVFVHLEGPDECGHGGDIECKVEAISRFDSRVIAPIREALKDQEVGYILACDHFTPIVEKTHTMDPVPFIIYGPGCEASGVSEFSEKTADTGMKIEDGHELLPTALKLFGVK